MPVTDNRPFYLNLLKIHLPVTGYVSILHRISGLLMFLAIPFFVYLLDISVQGSDGFNRAAQILQMPLIQVLSLLLLWSIIHHLFAGIRFLLTDFDIGLEKKQATLYAWFVFVTEALVFVFLGIKVFL